MIHLCCQLLVILAYVALSVRCYPRSYACAPADRAAGRSDRRVIVIAVDPFALADAQTAYARLQAGHLTGRAVVIPEDAAA